MEEPSPVSSFCLYPIPDHSYQQRRAAIRTDRTPSRASHSASSQLLVTRTQDLPEAEVLPKLLVELPTVWNNDMLGIFNG